MAVTYARFVNTFDEFRSTDQAGIEAKLQLALTMVEPSVWGRKTDFGVLYLTAHLVALGPAGQNAKLKPENLAKTVYGQEYIKVRRSVTFGLRVAGLPSAGAFTDPSGGSS